jgi:hypothetical protein
MSAASQRSLCAVLALGAIALSACGKGAGEQATSSVGEPARKLAPVAAQGAVSVATRNTTRLGGGDVTADAAAVARAVYPGLTAATRPQEVVLVDEHDWIAALTGAVLASAPTGAPMLFSEGSTLPSLTRQTLEAMRPLGAPTLGGAQVISIGGSAAVSPAYLPYRLAAGTPALTAAAVERLLVKLDRGSSPRQVIVLEQNTAPAMAMPAASLAAESGAPILLVTPTGVPGATAAVLTALHRPSIYVLDPAAVASHTRDELRRYGPVTTIPGSHAASARTPAASRTGASTAGEAVQNAIELARFTDGTFGWGVKEPGHGLVFANLGRPLDAPAAALLSATGDFGPLLLLASATQVPASLARYLSDIQPAYADPQFPPVRGAYNHGWLIGGEQAISAVTQAEIDASLEIAPRGATSEEASELPGE